MAGKLPNVDSERSPAMLDYNVIRLGVWEKYCVEHTEYGDLYDE